MRLWFVLLAGLYLPRCTAADDVLPSWNEGAAREAIVVYVERVTKEGSADFIRPAERIAVFDNDGTLWCEQPNYVQAMFMLDRIKALAPAHPEWRTTEPYASVLNGDLKAAFAGGLKSVDAMMMSTHAGMSTDEFTGVVRDWLATAKHPKYARPYTECVYQPMVELLAYLRSRGFKTYIVSGGGVDFIRPWAEAAYGVPPGQVIGSSIELQYELRGDQPIIRRLPQVDFVDDGPGKPAGIQKIIGRRPIAAFGNSDGDYEMLRWTTSGSLPSLALIVHHTDTEREFAYDRNSQVGQLAKALDEAKTRGWIVVDMKKDWKVVFQSH